jgi:hypothetical protein
VIVLRHPWYATPAGKGVSAAQEEAIHDVLRLQRAAGARALRTSLARGLDADHVQAVVLDYAGDGSLLDPSSPASSAAKARRSLRLACIR